jgi:uncharacterized protein YndB with AHSA1/START domain
VEQDIRVRGTVHAQNDIGAVRIEMLVPAPVDQVWAAATTSAGLAGWAGDVRGDLRVGGTYRAVLFRSGWDGTGRVLECHPGRRFVVESAEPGQRPSTDELELTPAGQDGTRVVLTQRGMPPAMIAAHGVGVQIHLETLAAHLGDRPPVDPDPFWDRLLPQYEALAAEI